MIKVALRICSIFVLLFMFSSCVTGKSITYFQDMEEIQKEATDVKNGLKIKPNDLLVIIVSADNAAAVQPFNLPVVNIPATGEATSIGGQQQLQTYLVDTDGNIKFPVLGTIAAGGKTRQELSNLLENKIAKYANNPIVNVRIANFQVTVLGEVNQPGTYSISGEYITLSKALGLAGDLTIYGKRQNILIIRDEVDKIKYEYVDLTDSSVLDSPYYKLKQNDVIYVEPIGPRKQAASYLGTASAYLSIASVITSLILIFTR